jgi:hypothetical protein
MTKDEALKMAIELLSKEDDYELQAFYDEGVAVKKACKQALEQKGHASKDSTLPKIDFDAGMNSTYIPLPNNWEIQTKGKGSSFRIAKTDGSKLRYIVTDERLHPVLEDIAKSCHTALEQKEQKPVGW